MINKESYYTYENEAIGAFAILEVLRNLNQISLAKSLLILPILLHDPVVDRLTGRSKYRSVDEFLIKERSLVGDVSLRLENLLPVTINAISILMDCGLASHNGSELRLGEVRESKVDVGNRAQRISKAAAKSGFLFSESDVSTYLKFNIEL